MSSSSANWTYAGSTCATETSFVLPGPSESSTPTQSARRATASSAHFASEERDRALLVPDVGAFGTAQPELRLEALRGRLRLGPRVAEHLDVVRVDQLPRSQPAPVRLALPRELAPARGVCIRPALGVGRPHDRLRSLDVS